MSQENVDTVTRLVRAFVAKDLDAMLDRYADDAVWRLNGGLSDMVGEEFKGHEGLRRFIGDWIENLGAQGELEVVHDLGDRVLAIVLLHSVGDTSGAPATIRIGQVYSFQDGLITHVDSYYDAREALEVVGLSE